MTRTRIEAPPDVKERLGPNHSQPIDEPVLRDRPTSLHVAYLGCSRLDWPGSISMREGRSRRAEVTGTTRTTPAGPSLTASVDTTTAGRTPACSRPTGSPTSTLVSGVGSFEQMSDGDLGQMLRECVVVDLGRGEARPAASQRFASLNNPIQRWGSTRQSNDSAPTSTSETSTSAATRKVRNRGFSLTMK